MSIDDIPKRWGWILIVILLSILIPYIVLSKEKTIDLVLYKDKIVRPLSINQLITLYSGKYKVNEKLARDIIYCESRFKPDALNIKAVVGEDVGLFQLNSYYWQKIMALNGWDIYDTEDNIEAGMWLLSESGSAPWLWSEYCWSRR